MLAIVVPDKNNSYNYYTYSKKCNGCTSGCCILLTDKLFTIMKNNMFNIITPDTDDCDDGSKVYHGDSSYITSVKWDDCISDIDTYINKAYELQEKIEDYKICKDV